MMISGNDTFEVAQGMEVVGEIPGLNRDIACIQGLNGRTQRLDGPEKVVLADLLEVYQGP